MNYKQFERLDGARREEIQGEVAEVVMLHWRRDRPEDYETLSSVLNINAPVFTTDSGSFEVKQALPEEPEPHTAELFRDFCDDLITRLILT